jgi:hypothetical protein
MYQGITLDHRKLVVLRLDQQRDLSAENVWAQQMTLLLRYTFRFVYEYGQMCTTKRNFS